MNITIIMMIMIIVIMIITIMIIITIIIITSYIITGTCMCEKCLCAGGYSGEACRYSEKQCRDSTNVSISLSFSLYYLVTDFCTFNSTNVSITYNN